MTIFNRQEHQQKHYQREPKDFSPKDFTTKVVVLGSGNPFPNPHRMGPSFAVIANDGPILSMQAKGFGAQSAGR